MIDIIVVKLNSGLTVERTGENVCKNYIVRCTTSKSINKINTYGRDLTINEMYYITNMGATHTETTGLINDN